MRNAINVFDYFEFPSQSGQTYHLPITYLSNPVFSFVASAFISRVYTLEFPGLNPPLSLTY